MMKKMFIILSAVILAVAFAIPASAVNWDFYGSVRMQTFRVHLDEEVPAMYGGVGYDDEDSRWDLNTVSRIGATVQNGDVGGGFEYGHYDSASNVTLRRLYGTWNFGDGELLVGKEYTPLHFVSNQVYDSDYGLRGFGGFFTFRPMIQLKIGGFKLALVKPGLEDTIQTTTGVSVTADDLDTTLPKIEASYTVALDNASLRVFGGYNQFDAVADTGTDEEEYDITSYIYGVAGVVNTGPVTLKAMIWGGQNVDIYGLTNNPEADATPKYDPVEDDIKDNDGYGGIVSIGVKPNDVIGVEAGVGYISFEDDVENAEADEALAIYLQAPITLAQGVTIVPEVGQYDYMDDAAENEEGKELYFGAKWQINF